MSFSPNKDIPDLAGKVIIVTGGNSGLGKESITQLGKHAPREIVMTARSEKKALEAIKEIETEVPGIKLTFLSLDLSSFDSIKKAARSILERYDRLDVLLNNAGLMGVPPSLTEDGYEMHFGSNHMGPALFTKLLLPLLEKTSKLPGSDVRVVQLSSDAHQFGPKEGILFSQLKTTQADISGTARYGQSKLANLLYIKSLAKRYPGIKCVSLHPGVVKTGLATEMMKRYPYLQWLFKIVVNLFFTDVHKGAYGQLWAATGRSSELESGAYYVPLKKKVTGNKMVNNDELAEKLWDWTEQELLTHNL
ncbi:NAD(P)-binding protein [Aaosphaeria arxii CBS 175.79]|uniref:NAD(P)-binding protein n=1 Tax=Aaosphaeria arxii CBS 175.79 TaxID=1450172 RepID=A0A6A5XDM0_9PLEO|nr:NAD(P)-binding protein [Aaosphaeria arxii CBS 175.79]KAF2010907.1 NAD(P)-binding protein [Aaosphaeria arxii CBS 175.79]